MSKESIEKTRQANIGRIPWNKGKQMSDEQKLKISETMKNNNKKTIKNINMNPLQLLQVKIGVTPDGSFGPTTLKAIRDYFKMSNERVAHFCAQTAHETGGFNAFSENLNYSAAGLQTTFGKYFPGNLEESYARQPVKIASRVYADRMGNGNEASQEGWKFRGRGALQTTGKNNYKEFSDYLKKAEIMTNPDLVATDYAFESAIFFFEKNNVWKLTDKGVNDAAILSVTKAINGGEHGLSERNSLTKRYYSWLK